MYPKPTELKYNEILTIINSPECGNSNCDEVRIALLSNATLDNVTNYLRYFCHTHRIKATIYQGAYDNVLQEVMDSESGLYAFDPDVIIVVVKKELLAENLVQGFLALSQQETEAEVSRILGYFNTIFSSIRKNTDAVVLFHNFEPEPWPALGILDYQHKDRQVNTVRRLNLDLVDLAEQYIGVYVVDIEHLQHIIGYSSFTDGRYWHMARAPYTRAAAELIAFEYTKFIKALKGKNKKCLVLDCDNTLWKGVLGEEGVGGIGLGNTAPGSFYVEFQKTILELYHRGIMLAICSKNNEDDVQEVLQDHPDMILRREHFQALKVNWNNKVDNIREIAEALNIGTDSLVFVDDSSFEIDMVKKFLPEVEAIVLPSDPSAFSAVLLSPGLFDSLSFSDEDRKRNDMYCADNQRKEAATSPAFDDLEAYYRYLEMDITIKDGDGFSIPRIAQMTQKTNQFNLTTQRYSEKDIESFCSGENSSVRCLSLRDRFGEMGIVGIAIINFSNGSCRIDTLLLSCRALGRGVEDVLLKDCERLARKEGCKRLTGVYRPTQKNEQVRDFYEKRGFSFQEEKESARYYVHSPEEKSLSCPDYFRSVKVE